MDSRPTSARIALVLVVAALAVACGAVFYRLAEAASGGPQHGFGLLAACVRMAIAGLLLGPAGVRAAIRQRPDRRAVRLALLSGVILAVHFATWISSLQYTTVAASTALVNTNPVWVGLLAWAFLGERPRARVLLGAAIAIAGGMVIAFADSSSAGRGELSPLLGDGLALAGAVAASAYFLLGRAAQRRGMSLGAYVGIAYAVAGLALLPAPALVGATYFELPALAYVYLALLALVPQLIGHTGVNWAVKHVDPTLVAVVLLLEPIGAGVGAAILFDERPSSYALAGVVVLLVGVLIAIRGSGSSRESAALVTAPDERNQT